MESLTKVLNEGDNSRPKRSLRLDNNSGLIYAKVGGRGSTHKHPGGSLQQRRTISEREENAPPLIWLSHNRDIENVSQAS